MKKLLTLSTLALGASLLLAACSPKSSDNSSQSAKTEDKTIVVASYSNPSTAFLEIAEEEIKEKGYELKIEPVSDYIQANIALENKDHDANLLQHAFFMDIFNQENDGHLVSIQPIYHSIAGYYGEKLNTIDDLADGARVAVPSDPSNMTRALLLLEEKGLITLKETDKAVKSLDDIAENPKGLVIEPVALLNLNQAYFEYDLVFNFPAYVAKIDLTPQKDGLLFEKQPDIRFAGSLVAREDNKDSEKIKVLKEALTSEKVKNYIENDLQSEAEVAF